MLQVHDDVVDRIGVLAGDAPSHDISDRIVEMTSRIESGEIPARLAEMEETASRERALDVVLATNMISVGRRRRSPGTDGRHGSAANHIRVHPGDEPGRAKPPGPRGCRAQRDAVARSIPLRVVRWLSRGAVSTGRVDERDPVLVACARARPPRRADRSRTSDSARCAENPLRGAWRGIFPICVSFEIRSSLGSRGLCPRRWRRPASNWMR